MNSLFNFFISRRALDDYSRKRQVVVFPESQFLEFSTFKLRLDRSSFGELAVLPAAWIWGPASPTVWITPHTDTGRACPLRLLREPIQISGCKLESHPDRSHAGDTGRDMERVNKANGKV